MRSQWQTDQFERGTEPPRRVDREPVGADGAIAIDLACTACGYNLRSLSLDGRCPECGRAVATSVQVFRAAPREYLQGLLVAVRNLAVAALLGSAVCVLGMLCSLAVGDPRPQALVLGLLIFFGLVAIVCTPALTLPFSCVETPVRRFSSRRIARGARIVFLVCLLFAPVAVWVSWHALFPVVGAPWGIGWLAAGAAMPFCTGRHLAGVLDWFGAHGLASWTRAWTWLALAAEVFVVLGVALPTGLLLGGRAEVILTWLIMVALTLVILLAGPLLLQIALRLASLRKVWAGWLVPREGGAVRPGVRGAL